MKYVARRLNRDDWKNYRDIRLEALKEEPDAFGSSYNEYKDRDDLYWVERVVLSEDINGRSFLMAVCGENTFVAIGGAYRDENDEWNIIAIYTKKDFRGMGLGSLLFEKILEELKNREIKKVFLRVNANRIPALSLYKKYGFKVLRLVPDQLLGDGRLHNEYEMSLEL